MPHYRQTSQMHYRPTGTHSFRWDTDTEFAAMHPQADEEWPEERVQALVARYEETDQLALQENLNAKTEWS